MALSKGLARNLGGFLAWVWVRQMLTFLSKRDPLGALAVSAASFAASYEQLFSDFLA